MDERVAPATDVVRSLTNDLIDEAGDLIPATAREAVTTLMVAMYTGAVGGTLLHPDGMRVWWEQYLREGPAFEPAMVEEITTEFLRNFNIFMMHTALRKRGRTGGGE